jgi:CMP-N,N'-diacetyllegionaminic acid synthase
VKNFFYCTICARGGSKGLVNKNILKINNKPLILYTVDLAIKSGFFDRIILSTDSKKIINLCSKKKIECFFIRNPALSSDKSSKILAIRDAVQKSEKYFNESCNYVCDLDVTSPLRNIKDITNSFKKFKRGNFDNLFTVNMSRKNPYFNMIELNKNKEVQLVKKVNKKISCRQDAPIVYEINPSIYFWKKEILFKNNFLFRKKTGIYLMPYNRSIDIDTPIDLQLVKYFFKNK